MGMILDRYGRLISEPPTRFGDPRTPEVWRQVFNNDVGKMSWFERRALQQEIYDNAGVDPPQGEPGETLRFDISAEVVR